uniref:Uncharacterized protein n=1 Tax=Romanomermis culicivorax TaxID=13658 RepID=A0A915JZR7_ROMCU
MAIDQGGDDGDGRTMWNADGQQFRPFEWFVIDSNNNLLAIDLVALDKSNEIFRVIYYRNGID